MWTTRSISSRPCASLSFSRSRGARGPPPRLLLMRPSWFWLRLETFRRQLLASELQPALAGRVRQGAHLAVVDVAAAVEDDLADSLLLGPLRDELPDTAGRGDVGRRLPLLLDVRVERRRRYDRPAGRVVDHLRVDVLAALEDRQARSLRAAAHLLPDPHPDPAPGFGSRFRFSAHLPPALPTLRRMTSLTYLMPFAL